MKFDEHFPKRLLSFRSKFGYTQSELAKLAGVAQRTIASYEIGESTPRMKALVRLANALQVSPEWLSQGAAEHENSSPIITKTSQNAEIPVLNDLQIVQFLSEEISLCDIKEFTPPPLKLPSGSFAYILSDDSMVSSEGGEYSFPVGTVLFFDPSQTSSGGDFVLVVVYGENPKVFFRKFSPGMGEVRFTPLNNSYPQDQASVVDLLEISIRVVPAVAAVVKLPTFRRSIAKKTS